MSKSTMRHAVSGHPGKKSERNVCRKVYQPEVVILTGVLHPAGGLLIGSGGLGQGFSGNPPDRVELVLAFIQKPGTKSPANSVPALNTQSRRKLPVLSLIAEIQSKR